jgi:hypothetical protein
VLNGVLGVEIVDAMPAGRGMDLHTGISYYRIQAAGTDERDFVAQDLGRDVAATVGATL